MTVKELTDKLQCMNSDKVVIWVDNAGGWTNIEINMDDSTSQLSTVSLVPSINEIFSDDKS